MNPTMAAPHVCILQTSFAKREDTVAFLKEKVPGVRVEFITDSTLLTDVRANGGPSQAVIDRMTLYAKAAEISGADLIVNSCSTVGEVADIYAKEVNVPVMKIDLPMAQEAVRLGTKIALIATLETTLGPSQRLIEKVGAEQGKKMECTQYLQNPAWDALQAGHPEEHNRILMESIRELDKMGYDAIVMAQVSMRALLPDPASLGPLTKGKTCIGNVMRGIKDGKEKTVYIYNICDHEACYAEVGSQAISYTTGVPAMIGAKMMVSGQWLKPGVWNMEQFDPDPFMADLNAYGLPWQCVEVKD